MKKELSIIDFAMSMEMEGKNFFAAAAERVASPQTRNVLRELSDWEEKHYRYLQEEKAKLVASGNFSKADLSDALLGPEKDKWQVFYARGDGEGPEPSIPVGERTSDMSVLRMAIFIENDLQGFYRRAAENTKDSGGTAMFIKLATWEGEHAKVLEAQYQSLQKEFWAEMGFSPF